MFFRPIVPLLAVFSIPIALLNHSRSAAVTTDQSSTATTEVESEVLLIAPDTEAEAFPAPVIDEPSADSAVSELLSDRSILFEPSLTAPVNLQQPTTTINEDFPAHDALVDARPAPNFAAPPTNSWAPAYHASQVHETSPIYQSTPVYEPNYAATYPAEIPSHPAMNTQNYRLLQYRRMMRNSPAPHPHELQGTWRGINKGIATVAIDERFIKNFQNVNGQIYGDNIKVQQNSGSWTPIQDQHTGEVKRQGKFLVQGPRGIGPFGNGLVLNYRKGGNRRLDPANLISDQLVMLDDNHMLGRATAKFGPIRIPLSYFVLERVPE